MKASRLFSFIFFFFGICQINPVFAQISPKIEWQKCYGGTGVEGFNPLKDKMILQTSDGGFVFVAETHSNDGDVSGNHKDNLGNYEDDIWLVKTNSLGNIIWQKCYGGGSTETPECLIQTHDGGYLVCGQTNSHDGDVTNNNYGWPIGSTFGMDDAWVFKTDSNGVIRWNLCLGGNTGEENLSSVVETNSGFIGVGYSSSREEGWFQYGPYFYGDALIIKFDSSGELWHKLYGGSFGDRGNDITATPDGGFIFTGYTCSIDGDVSGFHDTVLKGSTSDIWTVKIDPAGNLLWQKCYGGSSNEEGTSIISSSKGYLIGGYTTSSDGDITNLHGKQDALVLEIDSEGTLINEHTYGGSEFDNISSLYQTKDGNIAFAGSTTSIDGDLTPLQRMKSDSSDAWVGEIGPDWNITWQECLGGSGGDDFYSIAGTADGGFILNGKTDSQNGIIVGNHGKSDIWNVKLSPPSNRVESEILNTSSIIAYPNPSANMINMAVMSFKPISQIKFFNILGTQVYPTCHYDSQVITADISNLPDGIYFLKISFIDSNILQTSKFVHNTKF